MRSILVHWRQHRERDRYPRCRACGVVNGRPHRSGCQAEMLPQDVFIERQRWMLMQWSDAVLEAAHALLEEGKRGYLGSGREGYVEAARVRLIRARRVRDGVARHLANLEAEPKRHPLDRPTARAASGVEQVGEDA